MLCNFKSDFNSFQLIWYATHAGLFPCDIKRSCDFRSQGGAKKNSIVILRPKCKKNRWANFRLTLSMHKPSGFPSSSSSGSVYRVWHTRSSSSSHHCDCAWCVWCFSMHLKVGYRTDYDETLVPGENSNSLIPYLSEMASSKYDFITTPGWGLVRFHGIRFAIFPSYRFCILSFLFQWISEIPPIMSLNLEKFACLSAGFAWLFIKDRQIKLSFFKSKVVYPLEIALIHKQRWYSLISDILQACGQSYYTQCKGILNENDLSNKNIQWDSQWQGKAIKKHA